MSRSGVQISQWAHLSEVSKVAKCEICGKSPKAGFSVSHSNKKTKRMWKPNIQKITVLYNGKPRKMKVCTECIKNNRVVKYI